jgi:DNA-binding NtrC family response regulator
VINQESGNRSNLSPSIKGGGEIELSRLLIVEWDGRQREHLASIAGELGFEATACSTPAEAKELINATSFTGVVFDAQLYRESLEEFADWLASLGSNKPYVISVIDSEVSGELTDLLRGGVDDFLLKPVNPERLKARLAVMECRVLEHEYRHQEMARLRRAQGRYENLFLDSPDAIIVLKNRQGKVIGVNRAVKSILGYEGKSLLGKYMSLVFPRYFRPRWPGFARGCLERRNCAAGGCLSPT